MPTQIVKMVLKLDDKASPQLGKVGDEAGKADGKFGGLKVNAKALGLGLAAAGVAALGAAKAFVAMGQDFANQINLFTDMSASTGLSVDTLESLNLMAKATGVNLKGMERGLVSFQRNLGEARQGTGTLTKALETLQLDPEQFESTDDALKTVLSSIAQYGDGADRAKLLNEAFGLSAKDMAKVMRTGFDDASGALDDLSLRIGESQDDAAEAQRGLALYELVIDGIKRSAFDAFLGGGGFAEGLSVVVGIAKGLASLLGNISDVLTGLLSGAAKGIASLGLVAAGELEAANDMALSAQDDIVRFGTALHDIAGLMPVVEGIEAAREFRVALDDLGAAAERDQTLMSALADAQGNLADGDARAAEAAKAHAEALKLQAAEAKAAVKAVADLWSRANAIIQPATEARLALEGMIDPERAGLFGLKIEGLGRQLDRLSAFEGFGLDSDIRDAEQLLEVLAAGFLQMRTFQESGIATPSELRDFLRTVQTAFLEARRELEAKVEIEIRANIASDLAASLDSLEVAFGELAAGMAADQAREAGAIGDASGALTAAAGGDISGAAQGIGTALGASPMFGAIVGGLGAIAEIGKMSAREIKQNAKDFADNLANGVEVIIQALPGLVRILLRKLPGILIEGGIAMAKFMLSGALVKAVAQGVWEGIKGIGAAIRDALRDLFTIGDGDGFLSRFRVDPPTESFASGTAKVGRTGMALIHRGETIIPAGGRASQARESAVSPGGVTINISTAILDRDVIPRLVREIDRAVGTYGRTSAAFAGG